MAITDNNDMSSSPAEPPSYLSIQDISSTSGINLKFAEQFIPSTPKQSKSSCVIYGYRELPLLLALILSCFLGFSCYGCYVFPVALMAAICVSVKFSPVIYMIERLENKII